MKRQVWSAEFSGSRFRVYRFEIVGRMLSPILANLFLNNWTRVLGPGTVLVRSMFRYARKPSLSRHRPQA